MFFVMIFFLCFFFFKQKTAYELRISDWSSDVCSSDLPTHSPLARSITENIEKPRICQAPASVHHWRHAAESAQAPPMKRIVSSSAPISAKASKYSAEGGRRIRRSVTSRGPLSVALVPSAWRQPMLLRQWAPRGKRLRSETGRVRETGCSK